MIGMVKHQPSASSTGVVGNADKWLTKQTLSQATVNAYREGNSNGWQVHKGNWVSQMALERLERNTLKEVRCVLRGHTLSNESGLLDASAETIQEQSRKPFIPPLLLIITHNCLIQHFINIFTDKNIVITLPDNSCSITGYNNALTRDISTIQFYSNHKTTVNLFKPITLAMKNMQSNILILITR